MGNENNKIEPQKLKILIKKKIYLKKIIKLNIY